jgi:hypothetical protein
LLDLSRGDGATVLRRIGAAAAYDSIRFDVVQSRLLAKALGYPAAGWPRGTSPAHAFQRYAQRVSAGAAPAQLMDVHVASAFFDTAKGLLKRLRTAKGAALLVNASVAKRRRVEADILREAESNRDGADGLGLGGHLFVSDDDGRADREEADDGDGDSHGHGVGDGDADAARVADGEASRAEAPDAVAQGEPSSSSASGSSSTTSDDDEGFRRRRAQRPRARKPARAAASGSGRGGRSSRGGRGGRGGKRGGAARVSAVAAMLAARAANRLAKNPSRS